MLHFYLHPDLKTQKNIQCYIYIKNVDMRDKNGAYAQILMVASLH